MSNPSGSGVAFIPIVANLKYHALAAQSSIKTTTGIASSNRSSTVYLGESHVRADNLRGGSSSPTELTQRVIIRVSRILSSDRLPSIHMRILSQVWWGLGRLLAKLVFINWTISFQCILKSGSHVTCGGTGYVILGFTQN